MSEGKPEFLVRKMTRDDVDAVEAFYNSVVVMKYSRNVYEHLISPVSMVLLLVHIDHEDKETIIGLSSAIRCWKNSWSRERDAYLATFGISKKFRNQGLGTFLLNMTMRILKVFYNIECVMADCPKCAEKTFLFLRKREFNGQRIIEKFYRLQNEHNDMEDSVFMMRDLSEWNIEEYQVPENVRISDDLVYFLHNKQRLGLLVRWFGNP